MNRKKNVTLTPANKHVLTEDFKTWMGAISVTSRRMSNHALAITENTKPH